MAKAHPRLKLGKRASFVKTHLKQLPQEAEVWEVDFRAMPNTRGQNETHYLGVAVVQSGVDPLFYLPVEYTPSVNDLADLLADAMRRPLTGSARRPEHIYFRSNPRWEELFRHLNELGIETSVHEELLKVEEVYEDFLREMRKASPGLIMMLSPGRTRVAESFSAINTWVQAWGWIEIGRRKDSGFVVRALDNNGLVFENDKSRTLPEAMTALETGLGRWFKEKRTDLWPSVSPVEKKTRK